MKFTRCLSAGIGSNQTVADLVQWKKADCLIKRTDGSVVFEQKGVEVPEQWSQTAADMLAQKYFRKRGVPRVTIGVPEDTVPSWLQRRQPMEAFLTGGEDSARAVFDRMVGCWTYHGWKNGYFSSEEDARVFYDELFLSMAWQCAAPNSPQWFSTGLYWAYGIDGPASGQWRPDYANNGSPIETTNAYEYPQPQACFIQPVKDALVTPGGIMDLAAREALLFKYGSGTGTNFSTLRAADEKLEGGGVSSGLMSFLKIGDTVAGSIKSGGTTRRAAKMVICNMDHPEIESFIGWKVEEEQKAAAMYVGSQILMDYYLGSGDARNDPYVDVPQPIIDRMENGFEPEIFGCGYEESAINTVGGQNSNNSVRVTNEFLKKVDSEIDTWPLTERTTGKVVKIASAKKLWEKVCRAAWASADPGVQFDDALQEWHTCPNDGKINATNPCAEYCFLDDTACNLASLNLARFLVEELVTPAGMLHLNIDLYIHLVRIWQVVLDISVQMASFPSREIAIGSYKYRTTGLGPMNLAGFLMRQGIPYDSDEGRALAAGMMALMTGVAYRTSGEMAAELGPFPRWEANAESMNRVLRNHARSLTNQTLVGVTCDPPRDARFAPAALLDACRSVWREVERYSSFRNAQVTVCAPTGTISFVCDCDVTGIEPEFALAKYKKLAGGGDFRIDNTAVDRALRSLGYDHHQRADLLAWVGELLETEGGGKAPRGTIHDAPGLLPDHASVFSVAVDAAEGPNVLSPMAHIRMVASLQPFVSGGISKTINLPNSAPVGMADMAYRNAHRLGIKSVSLYRYGSKLSQPLNVDKKKKASDVVDLTVKLVEAPLFVGAGRAFAAKSQLEGLPALKVQARGTREFLPWRRAGGYTQKAKIGVHGQSVFWHVNPFPDGRPGELFIVVAHEGSTLRATNECMAIAVSDALQHGTPLESLVDKFVHTMFEPSGMVEGHDRIKFATSIPDLIFRDMAIHFLGREDLADTTLTTAVDDPDKIVALDRRAVAAVALSGQACPVCGNPTTQNGSCRKCTVCSYEAGCGG